MDFADIKYDVTIAGGAEGALLAGRYRAVRPLGQGGMGSVWLVEDTLLDSKQFAIKMLPSILVNNKRAYRQLKDEALVAMKLTHPNIVTLRAFEENNSNPFLVMDYVDGQTLDDYLSEKCKLTEEETVKLLTPIASALDYAHGEGVVHRDVKPANVMIRKDGHPFILDFGIAREIQETMTRVTGKLSSGTLLYMSPEQLDGDPPKKEQDIYSFAAMAYECLKGEPPFVRGAIEDQIKNKEPESLRSDGALAVGIISGLAKKPESRPPTCAAVLEGAVSRSGAETRRNIAGIALSIIGIATSLLIVGGVLWHREVQQKEAQRKDERKAQEEAARKRAESEYLAKQQQQEEARRKAEEEEAARIEAERKAKEDAERRANEEEAASIEAERKAADAERRAKEEEAARIEAERKAADAAKDRADNATAERRHFEVDSPNAPKPSPVMPPAPPRLTVRAELNGREVKGARMQTLSGDVFLPYDWPERLTKGRHLGPYRVQYDDGNGNYYGSFKIDDVNWNGHTNITVRLGENWPEDVRRPALGIQSWAL